MTTPSPFCWSSEYFRYRLRCKFRIDIISVHLPSNAFQDEKFGCQKFYFPQKWLKEKYSIVEVEWITMMSFKIYYFAFVSLQCPYWGPWKRNKWWFCYHSGNRSDSQIIWMFGKVKDADTTHRKFKRIYERLPQVSIKGAKGERIWMVFMSHSTPESDWKK